MPVMQLYCLFATITIMKCSQWCIAVSVVTTLTTYTPLLVFSLALYFLFRKFADLTIPLLVPIPSLRLRSDSSISS